MPRFQQIGSGWKVAPAVAQIAAHPELWNAHTMRKSSPGTPHSEMSDIWIRYNAPEKQALGRAAFNSEHIPVWYPGWRVLTELRPLVFRLMAQVEGEMLCGVLITRIPPGSGIDRHVDKSWHVDFTEKFYICLKGGPGAVFACDGEAIEPRPGDVHVFDNRIPHWVENDSDDDRMTLIVCIRTDAFGRPT